MIDDIAQIANLITEDPDIAADNLTYKNTGSANYTGNIQTAGARYDKTLQTQTANYRKLVKEVQGTYSSAVQLLKNDPKQLAAFLRLLKATVAADVRMVASQLVNQ